MLAGELYELLGVTDEFTYTASHSINNERREYFA
jgi:hypothetical protein